MPRFAANLGFSPLQPMKPGPGASSTSSSAPNQQRDGSEMVALPATGGGGGISEVPAAQFDWTSSGLVNPLDEQLVVVANLDKINLDSSSSCSVTSHETPADDILADCDVGPSTMGHLININPSNNQTSCNLNDGSFDWSIFDNFHTISSNAFASNGDGFTNKYPNKHLHNSFDTFLDISAPKVLPKSDDPKDTKEQPELAATTTSAASVAAASDTSESQSDDIHVAKEVSGGSVRPGATNILPQSFSQPLRETHIFTPSKSSNPVSREVSDHASVAESKIVVKEYRDVEYNPEKVARVDDDDFSDFTEFKGSSGVEEVGVGKKVPTIESPYRIVDKVVDFTKPTFGVSPTEEIVNGRGKKMKGDQGEEDDFCDFQSVTPQHSTKNSQTIAPILQPLNVMKLPESTPKIAWPSPGINPDEMARLEAIFPQKRSASLPLSEKVAIIETKTTEKSKDDDEWSDFVSGNNISSTSNRDDDWTDFMSGTPSAPASSSQKSLQQGPNFSSWTTPQLPPPQFTAWHHSNIFSQPPQYGPGGMQKATVAPQMINNNHLSKGNGQINGFPLVPPSLATISTGNAMYQRPRRPQTDTPSISVIPDMSFRAPKSLIQLPRSNYAKK
uniref:Aftiphilin clathrin-binding box domain-containing protein n=1 Tax=Phlebotomus papatasi TaxID=29031 RepID=A0A1B0D627_PHLPP